MRYAARRQEDIERDKEAFKKRIEEQKKQESELRILNQKEPIPRLKRKKLKAAEPPILSVNTLKSEMLLNDLKITLPSLRELANREDTPLSIDLAPSVDANVVLGKHRPKTNPNTQGFKVGQPPKKVFTSDKELYSKSGSLKTAVKPGLYSLPLRAPDHRVSIWDYTLEEIKNRDFKRQAGDRKQQKTDEEGASDFKLGNALG